MKSFLLSVVIPSYNEIANLRKGTLDKVEHHLERKKYNYEVIVVDDGSDDGSREFVRNFTKENKKFRLIENNHIGKAGAVTRGVLEARGDYIVIGSRSSNRRGAPLTRRFMAKGMIVLRSALVGFPRISDTQCGFKLFSKKAAREIFSQGREAHP